MTLHCLVDVQLTRARTVNFTVLTMIAIATFLFAQLAWSSENTHRTTPIIVDLILHDNGSTVIPPDPQPPTDMPVAKNSGGTVVIRDFRVSRTDCVSPCTVIFSADQISDTRDASDFDWGVLGYYIDYGDSQADEIYGRYGKGRAAFEAPSNGHSREFSNGPMGVHTYRCSVGTCTYFAGIAARNSINDWATSWKKITVRSQSEAFSGENTVCVSANSNFAGCPSGALRDTALPVAGNWQSDTRYMLKGGESFDFSSSCIEFDRHNILITTFGGPSRATISSNISIGVDLRRDGKCTDLVPSDADIKSFADPMVFISDITLDNLRVAAVTAGASFRNINLHNLDMNWAGTSVPGAGAIGYSSGTHCEFSRDVECTSIPLPQGLYLSQISIHGADANCAATRPRSCPPRDPDRVLPIVNVGVFNRSGMQYIGVVDSDFHVADEHNLRTEGASRQVIMHNDFFGDHLGTAGKKHKVTLRPEGYLNVDGLGKMRVEGKERAKIYDSRYAYVFDNYFGDPDSDNNASSLTLRPTKVADAETIRFGLVSSNYFDLSGGDGGGPSTSDVLLIGYDLACYDDSHWDAPTTCRDTAQHTIPNGFYKKAYDRSNWLVKPQAANAPSTY